MTEKKYSKVFWDWKTGPTLNDLKVALEPFGLHIVPNPAMDGSDSYGYFISDEVLTEREVDHLAEDVESETGTVCEDDLECEEVGA